MKHFPAGHSFKIAHTRKCNNAGVLNYRWTWELMDSSNEWVEECYEWWGFDTMNDALNDLAEHIEKTYGGTPNDY